MFGYVTINKPEIKYKDYDTYRSYYCGLCKELKKRYGAFGRVTLGYDMTFLIILLSGLYDTETKTKKARCILHPLKRHAEALNEFTSYAADMNLLMFYYHCIDDVKDERRAAAKIYSMIISGRVKKIKRKYPEKVNNIEKLMNILDNAEKNSDNVENPDAAAGIFGKILAEVFAYKEDIWEEKLRRMGFYLGKFIYLLDSYEDIEEDIKRNLYNPFVPYYDDPDFDDICGGMLKMMIAECAQTFEELPIEDNIEILRNILYAGVWSGYERTLLRRKEKKR